VPLQLANLDNEQVLVLEVVLVVVPSAIEELVL